jgi:hypothetical protein
VHEGRGQRRGKGGRSVGTYSGTLAPKVGNSVLEFEGESLTGGEFAPLTLRGGDMLRGKGKSKVITAA